MKTASFLRARWFRLGLSWIVGLVFLYAGVVKFRAPQDFADSIASFQLLPASLINPLALCLPWFEMGVGTLLLLGWWRRAAALAVLGMTTVFAVAMTTALARGLSVDCGCFGGGTPSAFKTWTSLGRDLLLIVAAALLYFPATSKPK